jgi:hypothetical protein
MTCGPHLSASSSSSHGLAIWPRHRWRRCSSSTPPSPFADETTEDTTAAAVAKLNLARGRRHHGRAWPRASAAPGCPPSYPTANDGSRPRGPDRQLQLGPSHLHTYSMAYLREVKNCNGKFQNTRIVMAFLQLWKIVMDWNQITLGPKYIRLLNE